MTNFLVPIIITIILVAIGFSVFSGVLLASSIYEELENPVSEITEIDDFLKFDKIENNEKTQPKIKTTSDHSETTIDFQIKSISYTEQITIMLSGRINNSALSEETYVDVYSIEPEVHLKGYRYSSSSLILDDGSFEIGFSIHQSNPDGKYKIIISHNNVSNEKTFSIANSGTDEIKSDNKTQVTSEFEINSNPETKLSNFTNFKSNPNWILENQEIGVNSEGIMGFQDGDTRTYSNIENKMKIFLWMTLFDTEVNALDFFDKGKQNVIQDSESPSMYTVFVYDENDLSSINADDCYAYKRQISNGEDLSLFTMFCYVENIAYLMQFVIPVGTDVTKNDVIVFTNQMIGTEHFLEKPKEKESYRIQWTQSISVPAGKMYGSHSHCQPGEHAVDGGVEIVEGDLRVLISEASGPRNADGYKGFTSWTANVVNNGSDYGVYKVFAKCAR